MKESKVFEYVVVYSPVDNEGKELEPSKIVKTGQVLAKNEQKAVMSIARLVPENYADKPDFVDILIRPF
jgi:hypothetical protein